MQVFFKLHHAFEQVSGPIACFISKILQFELLSFHSAWHQNRNAVSLKKVSPPDFPQCGWMLALEWKGRAFIEKVNSRRFSWFLVAIWPYWCTKTVHQYGISIQSSTKLCEMFWQITQKMWATKTWDLDKLFISQSFITFHFLGFFHWMVSNLIFCAVLTVKTKNLI